MQTWFPQDRWLTQERPEELLWPDKSQSQKPALKETGTPLCRSFAAAGLVIPNDDDDDDDEGWSDSVVSPSKVHRLSHILYMKEEEALVSYLWPV